MPSTPPAALVTGCSSGIGLATALRLGRDGFDVVATMRHPDRDGTPLLDAARSAGASVRLAALDVDDDASVAAAFAEAGPIDVLVNNAGIMAFASVEESLMDDARRVFETNVFGPLRCLQAALPAMREQGSGCIVNVSSAAARSCLPGTGVYSAAKSALEAMSETLAVEARPHGVRVVVIETGGARSAMPAKTPPPSRSSPYWPTVRNSMTFLGAMMADMPDADVVAEVVSRAARDPETPFRVRAGRWSEEIIGARRRLDDDAWISLWSSPTPEFVKGMQEASGLQLGG